MWIVSKNKKNKILIQRGCINIFQNNIFDTNRHIGTLANLFLPYIRLSAPVERRSVYKRINGKVKKIGVSDFIVIRIPDAVFRIGSLSKNFGRMSIVELQNQSFVRAEVECCGFDLKINVDSFTVCLITREPCTYKELSNTGNEIKKELKSEFQKLKKDDLVIFKNIYATGPNGSSLLAPVIVTVF